ncbi:MAG: sigma 54-interacting transcriptional regulator [Candidatus Latescibacteria bacterium]|nr:sigma 54-interacting transcriptional regulator [Candidatus Latescibacterota bacterium]
MPTLARLSFFLPPAQLDDFAALYDQHLALLLQPHGLDSGFSDDRPSVAGVLSRLFAVDSPTALIRIQQVLRHDLAWRQTLKDLGERLGVSVRYHLGIYATPAGEGKVVDAGPGRYLGQWHSFGVADGLASPLISVLLWGREGRLWIGTWDGLSCFDGAQFTHYTMADGLPGARVRSLCQDREGTLWIGTGGFVDGVGWGVCRFDGKEFVTYTTADGLAGNWVGALTEDRQGALWLGTQGGLSRFDGERFQSFTKQDGLAADWVWAIEESAHGGLWIGTEEGLCRMEEGGIRSRKGGIERRVYSILEQPDRLWVGGYGVGYYEGEEFTSLLERTEAMSLCADQQGEIWWADYGMGVRCYRYGQLPLYELAQGLANNQTIAVVFDEAGQLWEGSQGGGIGRSEEGRFFPITTQEGLADNAMYSLLADCQGWLWVGTQSGVNWYDGQQIQKLKVDEHPAHNLVLVFSQDRQGRLWMVTLWGVVKYYDGKEVVTIREMRGSRAHTARAIVEDPQGRMWFATGEPGVHCWRDHTWRTYTTADGLLEDDVRTLGLDSQGRLWLVTGTGTVSRLEGEGFVTVDTGEGLGHSPGRVIVEDSKGNLWFATDGGGASCWDGERFTRYTQAEGLVFDRVFSLWEDERGHLWFGTQGGGVSRFDGQVFQTLSTQDGLLNDVVQEIRPADGGEVWLATEGGLVRYRPGRTPPKVRIKAVVADRAYTPEEQIIVSTGQARLSFSFQGSSFTSRPDRLVYRYRLEGHDMEWRTTRKSRAEYLYVPVGEYTFQVQAVDVDLNYSEPATVKLEVVPDPRVEALTEANNSLGAKGRFVGSSPALLRVATQLRQVAATDLTVLIQAESGAGKGLAAHFLHDCSPRRDTIFVVVDCGGIPDALIESELFGHEKGAFTGAVHQKMGKIEMAQGGTLFLDEIGDLPLPAQTRLLRLLQDHTFERVGGTQVLRSTARIVAATNRDLAAMVKEGTFRQDLYYRLKVFPVQLPPLRQRREDVPALARHFLAAAAAHQGKPALELSAEALRALVAYDWPGNVRELEHLMARMVTLWQEGEILAEDLGIVAEAEPALPSHNGHLGHNGNGHGSVLLLEEMERRHIQGVLEQAGWVLEGEQGAAALLGLAPSTLRNMGRPTVILGSL